MNELDMDVSCPPEWIEHLNELERNFEADTTMDYIMALKPVKRLSKKEKKKAQQDALLNDWFE